MDSNVRNVDKRPIRSKIHEILTLQQQLTCESLCYSAGITEAFTFPIPRSLTFSSLACFRKSL